jgi:hypothetical protein
MSADAAAADSAGAADDAPMPEGIILSSSFSSSGVLSTRHLFFDDDMKYIGPVQELANAKPDLNLQSVYCEIPVEFVLHNQSGAQQINVTTADKFRQAKLAGLPNSDFKIWLSNLKVESLVGTGLTVDVISKLIHRETQSDKKCMYFFDFDQTLSYVKSLNFDFSKVRNEPPQNFHQQYARYIFSDFCGEEPEEGGRLRLLQRLFGMIGPQRIYIVTSNEMACPKMRKTVKDQTTGKTKKELGSGNPFLPNFISLIQQLLPTFNHEHLISVCTENTTSHYKSKEKAISSIITQLPKGGSTNRKYKSSSHKKKYSRRLSKKTKYERHNRRTRYKHKYRK